MLKLYDLCVTLDEAENILKLFKQTENLPVTLKGFSYRLEKQIQLWEMGESYGK